MGTSILAVVDALPCPGEVRRERVGDLSSWMRECSQIQSNKGDRTSLCGGRDTEKADETDVLVPGDLDLINRTEPTKIIPQLFLGRVPTQIQTPEIHVPAGAALLDRQSNLAGNQGRLFPTDFQLLSAQG